MGAGYFMSNNGRVFSSSNEGIFMELGKTANSIIFIIKIPVDKASFLGELNIGEKADFLEADIFTITKIWYITSSEETLTVKGEIDNPQAFKKLTAEDLGVFNWVELFDYKITCYKGENYHFLHTHKYDPKQTDYNFVYTFPNIDKVNIKDYFRDDPEDKINKIDQILTEGDEIIVKGRKTKSA